VNAAVAIRARRQDVESWQIHGVEGWAWDDVLESFKALENSDSGDDAYRGRTGPVPVRPRTYDELTPGLRGFIDASVADGYKHVDDFNGGDPEGVSGCPVNIVDGVRQSTAVAYLTDEVRRRPNLTIVGDVVVDKVLFDGATATGVISSTNEVYPAKEVILSAGTYGSAAILLRSGVGPAHDLAELGIATIADLPVGQRLQDQPIFYNAYALSNDAVQMSPAVVLPESVGTLRISSTDPRVAPLIDNNFLATERDQLRMLEAMKTSRRLARGPVFGPLQAGELIPGDAVGDEALPEVIAANLATYGHPTSTVPMGGAIDPSKVGLACVHTNVGDRG
jgi:choline dehydrogenase